MRLVFDPEDFNKALLATWAVYRLGCWRGIVKVGERAETSRHQAYCQDHVLNNLQALIGLLVTPPVQAAVAPKCEDIEGSGSGQAGLDQATG